MRSLAAYIWICLAGVLLAGPAWSCSPPIGDVPELTKAQLAHYPDTILVGKILETYPDPEMHYGGEAYWAAMKVYCIYKGTVSTSVVNITHVGVIPGLCHSTKLEKGSEYIVYLDGQQHRITHVQIDNTELHRLEVSKACGLDLKYPEGISQEDLPHSCPEPASETECTPKHANEDVTMPGPPAPPGNDDHDSHGHESHDLSGHDHEGHGHEGHGHDEYDHEDHDHEGHTHAEHDKHDEQHKQEHGGHDDDHGHDGHDHDGHDHEGHGHDEYEHEGHGHVGHTHEDHDKHDQQHKHEHDEGHDHEHDHEHDAHDHGGHDHEGHDHDDYDHGGHDHVGHTHEDHDKHDQHHEDEHGHEVKAGASRGSDESSSSRSSHAMGVLFLSLGICLLL